MRGEGSSTDCDKRDLACVSVALQRRPEEVHPLLLAVAALTFFCHGWFAYLSPRLGFCSMMVVEGVSRTMIESACWTSCRHPAFVALGAVVVVPTPSACLVGAGAALDAVEPAMLTMLMPLAHMLATRKVVWQMPPHELSHQVMARKQLPKLEGVMMWRPLGLPSHPVQSSRPPASTCACSTLPLHSSAIVGTLSCSLPYLR